MKPGIFKGEIISCPECFLDLMKVKRDIFRGEVLDESMFEAINFQIKNGDAMNCKECGTPYAGTTRSTSIHVKNVGWV